MDAQEQARLKDLFNQSCCAAARYPCNLVFPGAYQHQLEEYLVLLNQLGPKIFCSDSKTAIDFLEVDDENAGLDANCVYTYGELDNQLRLQREARDPLCRYIFITAPNARSKLKADREMFVRILSYHQVTPLFLDFAFSFGEQQQAKDFQFCGFRSEPLLRNETSSLELRHLQRSGRALQLCYELRSVERGSQIEWPWSIRQCAVYHSYDVETDVATWIVIKANKLMETRIKSLIEKGHLYEKDTLGAECTSFRSTLRTHLLIASWSAEQWRWYIDSIEEKFQQISSRALTESTDLSSAKRELIAHNMDFRLSTPAEKQTETSSSYDQLQEIHYIEERAAEALLVIKADSDVLSSLECYYDDVAASFKQQDRPEDGRKDYIHSFKIEIKGLQKQLDMERQRLDALLRLLEGRKSLLGSMLQHRSALMSFLLAHEAQESTKKVEGMTKQMHKIAQSTQLETVSMRIITFVTLVYLPGTFVSTLMSTPVVTFAPADFSHRDRHIDLNALGLFSAISLPLLTFTVAVWYFFKWRAEREDKKGDRDADAS